MIDTSKVLAFVPTGITKEWRDSFKNRFTRFIQLYFTGYKNV